MKNRLSAISQSRAAIWIALVVISVWLAWQGYIGESIPYGDVSFVYEFWANQTLEAGYAVGIDAPWVYPVFALVPIVLPALVVPMNYAIGWILLVTVLNAAVVFLLGFSFYSKKVGIPQSHLQASSWFYLGFLLALGPISVSRLESVVSPVMIIGMLLLLMWPAVAGAILAAVTWIKVWPAAALLTAVLIFKKRLRILLGAVVFSATVILISTIVGGFSNLFSFLGEQSGRGLQIEAPFASPLLWLAINNVPGYNIYYDNEILTYQVNGQVVPVLALWSNVLLGAAVIGILVWGFALQRKNVDPKLLFPSLTLIVALALIVFNKVGSPQYVLWLVAPVLVGLVFVGKEFKLQVLFTLVIALLTQWIYPYNYIPVLFLDPFFIGVLTLRNTLFVVLLTVAMWKLHTASKRAIWLPTKPDSIKNAS